MAPAMREQEKALRKAREALEELTTTAQYEEARAKGLADASAKAESQIILLRARAEREIYLSLTPAQREKMLDLRRGKELHGYGGPPPR
jgi:Spy/CpxP family protein refolding chaperone